MRLPLNPPRHRNAARRVFGAALLAVLLGQWAVLAHSIAHARPAAAVSAETDADLAWGHAADTPVCQLVDHLLIGQAAGGEPAAMACLPPAAAQVAAPAASARPGPDSRAYDARGPPRA